MTAQNLKDEAIFELAKKLDKPYRYWLFMEYVKENAWLDEEHLIAEIQLQAEKKRKEMMKNEVR